MKRLLPCLLATLVLLSFCQSAFADEPQPVHRYADDRLPPPVARWNLLLTGSLVTAGFYGAGLAASYLWPDARGAKDLRIPVVGPFMAVGRTKLCENDKEAPETCNNPTRIIGAVLSAVSGIGQAGGLALVVQSLFLRTAPLSERPTIEQSAAAWRNHYALSRTHHRSSPFTFKAKNLEISAQSHSVSAADFGLSIFGKF